VRSYNEQPPGNTEYWMALDVAIDLDLDVALGVPVCRGAACRRDDEQEEDCGTYKQRG